MITVKIAAKDVQIKADTGAEATVVLYELYTEITNKPLQKIQQALKRLLAPKPIYPKGSVRLPIRWGSDELNLLCIVVVEGTNVIIGHKCNKGHKCNNICSQL